MVVVMCVLGVAASEGELAEEVVRLRGRVFVQFGACRCVWCDNAERGGDDALLLRACDGEVVGVFVADRESVERAGVCVDVRELEASECRSLASTPAPSRANPGSLLPSLFFQPR